MPNVKLGDLVPDFTADTTEGTVKFHDWIGDSWAVLFSHPADYTPVCTTELGRVEALSGEFQKRGVKLIALSCDEVESHKVHKFFPVKCVDRLYSIFAVSYTHLTLPTNREV